MPTNTKSESNQRTGLERVMVSPLAGSTRLLGWPNHLPPTPQRASVVQAIRLGAVSRKEGFAPREKDESMPWTTTAAVSVVGWAPSEGGPLISVSAIMSAMSDARPGRFYSVDELAALLHVDDRMAFHQHLRSIAAEPSPEGAFRLLQCSSDEFYRRVSVLPALCIRRIARDCC